MKKRSALLLLSSFAATARQRFIWAVVTTSVSILFTFATPQIVSFMVDNVMDTKPASGLFGTLAAYLKGLELSKAIVICALMVIVSAALAALFDYLSKRDVAIATERLIKRLRDALFSRIQRLPFAWHTQNQTGDIIQRCISDVETIRAFVSSQLIGVVRTVLLVGAALAFMFAMNTTLALVTLATIPVIVLYSLFFHGRIARQFRRADEAEGELMIAVQENLTGVRTVRAFGREALEKERFEEKNDIYAKLWVDLGYTFGFFWGIGDLASCLQLLAVICTGAYLAAKGNLTLGQYIVFVSYTQAIAGPVRNLGRVISEMSKTGVSVDRVQDILDAQEETYDEDALTPPLTGDIVFEDVCFAYGENLVLEDINLTIQGGSTVGILGPTGSGKSTLTYLINRLYELQTGSIRIGGVDIREIKREYLRKNVGLVLQEPFLFSKTVMDNILIAAEEQDRDAAVRATKIAEVDQDIREFTHGYDTVVGERGVTLSGGQKQRVAIARTLVMGRPIMIFDDSMSAVDMETGAAIREALRKNTAGATVILVSHRINTLMQADQIVVIEDGCIQDTGTHQELISRPGIYRRVYDVQTSIGLPQDEEGGVGAHE